MGIKVILLTATVVILSSCACPPDMKTAQYAYNSQDYETAYKNYKPLADFGLPEAQLALGQMYLYGKGPDYNPKAALKLFEKSYTQKKTDVAADYITRAKREVGVKNLKSGADMQGGLALLREAAKQGDAQAIYELGTAYKKGTGVRPDIRMAIQYYQLAAEKNYPRACLELGKIYEKGNGVSRDLKKARNYYELAQQGGIDSQKYIERLNTANGKSG